MPANQSSSLRPNTAAEFLGISVPTLWRWAKNRPDFPQPIRLSARCTVFDSAQLHEWRESQRQGKGAQ